MTPNAKALALQAPRFKPYWCYFFGENFIALILMYNEERKITI
tara:strand:+ start:213 stop:341 length:129 start_codon:yes stop_codon:yes gene_type:complete